MQSLGPGQTRPAQGAAGHMPPGTARLAPNNGQKDPVAIALATELRHNKTLKQRTGIVSNTKNRSEFFRYKRFERALLSEEYQKKQLKSKGILPVIKEKSDVQQQFIKLIQNQLVLPVQKLETKVAKSRSIAIDKKTPALELINKAGLAADEYYVWNFTPPNPYLVFYTIAAIVIVFAVILFPLWPVWMRRGVWYLSNLALGFVALFFGLAIVRLVIYVVTLVSMKNQLWIFPNLFEDCGVLESFQPSYEWTSGAKKSKKKAKKQIATAANGAETVNTQTKETANDQKHVTTQIKNVSGTTGAATQTTATKRTATIEEVQDDE